MKRLGRYFCSLLLAALITGCSSVHLTQDPKSMLVRTGSIDVELDAAPYADVFLTYALLSDQAYKDGVYEDWRFVLEDKTYCHPAGEASCVDLTPLARSILSQWR